MTKPPIANNELINQLPIINWFLKFGISFVIGIWSRRLLCRVGIPIIVFIASGLLVIPAVAMGSAPPPPDTYEATVEYVRDFGFAGSGERQFHYPQDAAVGIFGNMETGLGNIFVADTGNNRIQRIDEEGGYVYQFGGFGSDNGKMNSPAGVAVDFNFQVYVSEKDNDRIQLYDIRGNYLRGVATEEVGNRVLYDPAGMSLDRLGNLYVADSGNDRILKFNDAGTFVSEIGGFGMGEGFFDRPNDVAVDTERYIYVADTGNNRIQKLDIYGRLVKVVGGFSRPQGVAIDDKFLYVADTGNNRVQVFSLNGVFLASYGEKGAGEGEFNNPTGICVGKNQQLYVADTGNHRLVELKINKYTRQ